MMSGSSHAAERQLLEQVVRDKGSGPAAAGELVTASVLVEPVGGHRERDGVVVRSRRSSSCTQTDEEAIRPAAAVANDDRPARRQDGGGDQTDTDQADGQPMVSNPAKPDPPHEEEEGCGIRCLYYTMQCCECALM